MSVIGWPQGVTVVTVVTIVTIALAEQSAALVYVYVIGCVPMPAIAGLKIPPVTPAPEYVPPSGMPPLSLKGLALVVVIVSKQAVNVTIGANVPLMEIG